MMSSRWGKNAILLYYLWPDNGVPPESLIQSVILHFHRDHKHLWQTRMEKRYRPRPNIQKYRPQAREGVLAFGTKKTKSSTRPKRRFSSPCRGFGRRRKRRRRFEKSMPPDGSRSGRGNCENLCLVPNSTWGPLVFFLLFVHQ